VLGLVGVPAGTTEVLEDCLNHFFMISEMKSNTSEKTA
jgi:hypothetical protein